MFLNHLTARRLLAINVLLKAFTKKSGFFRASDQNEPIVSKADFNLVLIAYTAIFACL